MNAIAKRFVKAIKDECLSRMVFFGDGMLHKAITEFVEHYHTERKHQGLGNRLLQPGPSLPVTEGTVHRHVRLGGLLLLSCKANSEWNGLWAGRARAARFTGPTYS